MRTALVLVVLVSWLAAIALTFYSSFFSSRAGIAEAVRALGVYARRGLEPGTHGLKGRCSTD